MGEHTPEPWQIDPINWLSILDATENATTLGQGLICQVNGKRREEANANRLRIVACINACEGIATDKLKPGLLGEMARVFAKIMQQSGVLSVLEDDDREQARALLKKLGKE